MRPLGTSCAFVGTSGSGKSTLLRSEFSDCRRVLPGRDSLVMQLLGIHPVCLLAHASGPFVFCFFLVWWIQSPTDLSDDLAGL